MQFINTHFKWLMLMSGVLTASMFYGLVAPQALLASTFGATFADPLALMVTRSWSALVGLMGLVLIYGALVAEHRRFAALLAATSKAVFVGLLLIYGQTYWPQAVAAMALDTLVVALTLLYLVASRQARPAG